MGHVMDLTKTSTVFLGVEHLSPVNTVYKRTSDFLDSNLLNKKTWKRELMSFPRVNHIQHPSHRPCVMSHCFTGCIRRACITVIPERLWRCSSRLLVPRVPGAGSIGEDPLGLSTSKSEVIFSSLRGVPRDPTEDWVSTFKTTQSVSQIESDRFECDRSPGIHVWMYRVKRYLWSIFYY